MSYQSGLNLIEGKLMKPTTDYSAKILLLLCILLLTACHDDSYEHHHYDYPYYDYPIVHFDMIDTDGTNSSFESVYDLNISPYINGGHFELFWETLAYSSYSIDIRVNTWPSLIGSQLLYTDTCGSFYLCDNTPILYCDYQTDFDIACESFFGHRQVANIGHLLTDIPQQLYFILDVCDNTSGYCDYQTLPVIME